jgi:hypothetical protein
MSRPTKQASLQIQHKGVRPRGTYLVRTKYVIDRIAKSRAKSPMRATVRIYAFR